jgi:hypothetical protein
LLGERFVICKSRKKNILHFRPQEKQMYFQSKEQHTFFGTICNLQHRRKKKRTGEKFSTFIDRRKTVLSVKGTTDLPEGFAL